jgi:hypothetical protein
MGFEPTIPASERAKTVPTLLRTSVKLGKELTTVSTRNNMPIN